MDRLVTHFCAVNGCTEQDFRAHKAEAYKIWGERSQADWTIDFGNYSPLVGR